MNRSCAALVCSVLASGCGSTGVYPATWAKKSESGTGECPDIAGEYQSEGESFSKAGNGELERHTFDLAIALQLGPDANDAAKDAHEKIRLEMEYMALRVTVTGTDGGVKSFELPVLRCKNSMMVIDANWTHSTEEPGGTEALTTTLGMFHWFERSSWMLTRAEDGSLLMQTTRGGSLMLFWMPVLPGGDSNWIRFPAVTPGPEHPAAVVRKLEEMPLAGR